MHLRQPREFQVRLGLLYTPKRHLLHLLPHNHVGSMTTFPLELVSQLTDEYQHTVLLLGEQTSVSWSLVRAFQGAGAQFLHADSYGELGDLFEYSAAIAYDLDCPLDLPLPTIYYAYSRYREDIRADVVLAPSCITGEIVDIPADYYVPPAVRSRLMRGLYRHHAPVAKYTVAVMSSDLNGRYPTAVLDCLHATLPQDVRIVALDNCKWRPTPESPRVWLIPTVVDAVVKGCQEADAVVYAHDPSYTPTFGRQCLELMASGLPVLCEARGAPVEMFGRDNAMLFFNSPEELPGLIRMLRDKPELARQLGANAQLKASWYDITIHVGKVKRVLRALGA